MGNKDLVLLSERVKKGNKEYLNFILSWNYNGKTWTVKIKPSFRNDVKVLLASSETLTK